jgi:hypothetical protein
MWRSQGEEDAFDGASGDGRDVDGGPNEAWDAPYAAVVGTRAPDGVVLVDAEDGHAMMLGHGMTDGAFDAASRETVGAAEEAPHDDGDLDVVRDGTTKKDATETFEVLGGRALADGGVGFVGECLDAAVVDAKPPVVTTGDLVLAGEP